MKKLILFITTFFQVVIAFGQADTIQKITPGRKNSLKQQNKPYVILISADGFRYDYAKKYQATHLLALSKEGVSATSMIPSYPSATLALAPI